jgi:hypothetical protein
MSVIPILIITTAITIIIITSTITSRNPRPRIFRSIAGGLAGFVQYVTKSV